MSLGIPIEALLLDILLDSSFAFFLKEILKITITINEMARTKQMIYDKYGISYSSDLQ
jgi:hypothetical protein